MKRLAKGEGYGNVFLEEVPVPAFGPDQVLVKTHTSLISRGSEILRRYREDGPVDPDIMGYSVAGTVVEAGPRPRPPASPRATGSSSAPPTPSTSSPPRTRPGCACCSSRTRRPGHAHPSRAWPAAASPGPSPAGPRPDDTVVVLGQGLVGNLVMQAHRARGVGRVIAVDPLDLRVRCARAAGADVVVHAGGGGCRRRGAPADGRQGRGRGRGLRRRAARSAVLPGRPGDGQGGRHRAPDRPLPRPAPGPGLRARSSARC